MQIDVLQIEREADHVKLVALKVVTDNGDSTAVYVLLPEVAIQLGKSLMLAGEKSKQALELVHSFPHNIPPRGKA